MMQVVGEPRVERFQHDEVRIDVLFIWLIGVTMISILMDLLQLSKYSIDWFAAPLQIVVIPLRANVNLKSLTVEEKKAQRKVVQHNISIFSLKANCNE